MLSETAIPSPEEVKHIERNTTAFVNSNRIGKGSLFIAESRLSWLLQDPAADPGQGFELQYPCISLHAVSRDLTSFPFQCLYLMLDAASAKLNAEQETEAASSESAASPSGASNVTGMSGDGDGEVGCEP